MRGHRAARIAKFAVFGLLFFAVFTYVVMRLWNWLMPELFGLHVLTYWQALGILVLSKILFGGFFRGHRGWQGGMNWRRRMLERWEQMSPEEREKFRERMRQCGPWGPAEEKQT